MLFLRLWVEIDQGVDLRKGKKNPGEEADPEIRGKVGIKTKREIGKGQGTGLPHLKENIRRNLGGIFI